MTEPDDGRSEQRRPGTQRRTDRLGELLPERTSDESATGWGDRDDSDADDEHLRREVPPHHG